MIFPNINDESFTEKDKICHALIESQLFKYYSNDYLLSMIRKLKEYREKNGEEIIIDILFMKYLKKLNSNSDDIRQLVQTLINNNELNSQYHIALKYLYDLNEIKDQMWKFVTDNFIINGIKISNVILFYLFKKNTNYISKELLIGHFYENMKENLYENKYILIPYTKNIDENKIKYREIMNNINQFYSIKFWTDAAVNEAIDNNIINIKNNPYLFNAAACLCYKNPMIKVNYNLSDLKFPDRITLDLVKLIRYQLRLDTLLEYKTYFIEVKNLCSFVYLLILDQTKINDLEKYKDSMSTNSYCILLLVYMNYINECSFFDHIYSYVFSNYTFSNDLLLFYRIFKSKIYQYKKNGLVFFKDNEDLFYVYSKNINFDIISNLSIKYGIYKKKIMKENNNLDNNEFNDCYKNDFLRFLSEAIKHLKGYRKLNVIDYYCKFDQNENIKKELIFGYIELGEYGKAVRILNETVITPEFLETVSDEIHMPIIVTLLRNINRSIAIELIKKLELKDKLRLDVKFNIFIKFSLSTLRLDIRRDKILEDSINYFKKNVMKDKFIRISYVSEKGQDEGGLAKDWFTNVANELIKVNAFVPVPNETSLTFNKCCNNSEIYEFTGKLIALALTNKRNIGIKLTSFIWKKLLDEEVTIEDLNDYDSEFYQSLKWILENDPEPLMMTFVDSNDEELCPNGRNIDLTNDNKEKFISLMIEKKLIEPNLSSIQSITKGFADIINVKYISILSPNDLKNLVNGNDKIDLNDWKKNIRQNNDKMCNEFFNIISYWSQENIKKLLKFVTGTSILPIGGFNGFNNIGGLFKLNFLSYDSDNLPQSHTCFNTIDIPYYKSKEKFEQKLLYAIECDSFGFA